MALALRPRIGGGYAYLFGEVAVKASWRDVYALVGAQVVQNWDSLGWERNIRYTLDGTPAFLVIGLGMQRGDLFAEVRAHFGLNPTILETVYPGELWGLDHTITLEKWRYGAVSVNVGWLL